MRTERGLAGRYHFQAVRSHEEGPRCTRLHLRPALEWGVGCGQTEGGELMSSERPRSQLQALLEAPRDRSLRR